MKLRIDVKEISSCEKVLTIDVPSELVVEEFSSFYQSIGKRARIPGFRPGHAPKGVLELHFRDEARQEVWKQLVSKSFHRAVEQVSISMVGYPRIENVTFDETRLKYKAHVETRPKIKIGKYIGLSLKREPVAVTESEMEQSLKRLQESHAKYQAVEGRDAALGDFLICDYQLLVEGKEVEKRSGDWFEIREKDYLDGFSKQLIGAKPGESLEVNVTFPADYVRKELAGKEAHFLVSVREIKEKKIQPLDDEFAKELGEYERLEDLKKAIREDLVKHKKAETERKLEQNLLNELIKTTKFDVPRGLLERRLDALLEEGLQTLMYRGAKQEEALGQRENLKKNLLPEAERQIRVSFLLDEVATREGIRPQDEDVESRYEWIARESRRSLEEVKKHNNNP